MEAKDIKALIKEEGSPDEFDGRSYQLDAHKINMSCYGNIEGNIEKHGDVYNALFTNYWGDEPDEAEFLTLPEAEEWVINRIVEEALEYYTLALKHNNLPQQ